MLFEDGEERGVRLEVLRREPERVSRVMICPEVRVMVRAPSKPGGRTKGAGMLGDIEEMRSSEAEIAEVVSINEFVMASGRVTSN